MNKVTKTCIIIELLVIIISLGCYSFLYYKKNENNFKETIQFLKVTKLDLSNEDYKLDEYINQINKYPFLKEVVIGDNKLSNIELKKLQKDYPEIIFNANTYVDFYGEKLHSNDEELDLRNKELDNKLLDYLKEFSNIKKIKLDYEKIDYEDLLTIIKDYPNTELEFNITINGEKFNSNVDKIDFTNKTNLDYKELEKKLMVLPKLKYVDLSFSNLSNEQCDSLNKKIENAEIVWTVHFGGTKVWYVKTDAIAFSTAIAYYQYTPLTSEDIQVLKYCTKLKALDLGHQQIHDLSVIGELTELRVLILVDNGLTDITPLKNLKHLHYLELFFNKITDLSPIENLDELIDLNIGYNRKLTNIDTILKYSKLERLWAPGTQISEESFNKIRTTYPNVKLVTEGTESVCCGWRTHPRYYEMRDMFNKNYYGKEFSKYD